MSNELISADEYGMTRNQIEIVKEQYAKGASDDELRSLLMASKRTGMDIFARQIYLIPRWDSQLKKMIRTPQASIDGYRAVAARSGEYEGQVGPFWCGPDGKWVDVWLTDDFPVAAKVGVWRRGFREPKYAIAKWNSYVQRSKDGGVSQMWSKMPDLMLAKCAESLALRAAFPNDLSGVYTTEEMSSTIEDDRSSISIKPEQPTESDGQPLLESDYRIPFGKYVKRKIEEIDLNELRDYINFLEASAAKKPDQPIREDVKEFLGRAIDHVAFIENQPLK